jgi:hypothetical protein
VSALFVYKEKTKWHEKHVFSQRERYDGCRRRGLAHGRRPAQRLRRWLASCRLAHHHKIAGQEPVEVQFTYLQAVTANIANPATASGVSTPQVHFELRSQDNEVAAASAQYWQFQNCVLVSRGWTETEEGNQFQETWRALAISGVNASGYIL